MRIVPLTLAEANAFVRKHHRHTRMVQHHRFSLGCIVDGRLVGVAVIGRPACRQHDQNIVAEVSRLTTDGTRNAYSFLLGAAARACKAMGFERIQSFTLQSETGASLRAVGWRQGHESSRGNRRPRPDEVRNVPRWFWFLDLNDPVDFGRVHVTTRYGKCAACRGPMPRIKRTSRVYCSDACRQLAYRWRFTPKIARQKLGLPGGTGTRVL
jgi:hypothetical protein